MCSPKKLHFLVTILWLSGSAVLSLFSQQIAHSQPAKSQKCAQKKFLMAFLLQANNPHGCLTYEPKFYIEGDTILIFYLKCQFQGYLRVSIDKIWFFLLTNNHIMSN